MTKYNNEDFVHVQAISACPLTGLSRKLCIQEINTHERSTGDVISFQNYIYLTDEAGAPVMKPQLNNPFQVQMDVTTERVKRLWPGEKELAFGQPYASLSDARTALETIINTADADNFFNG